MTRDALADRLVNYADAATAFALVNSLAFILSLTETDVRCSVADLAWFVYTGQTAFGAVVTLAIVVLRRLELRVRAGSATPADVLPYLRGFFLARVAVVWLSVVFALTLGRMALSDPACFAPPAP